MHCDIIDNKWYGGYQELVERIEPDDPRAKWHGDYRFVSEPHTEEDCPFKDTNRLPFVSFKEL